MPRVPAHPTVVHPLPEQPRVALLKPLITSSLIEVGEFSFTSRLAADPLNEA